jgi:hypothetical protein
MFSFFKKKKTNLDSSVYQKCGCCVCSDCRSLLFLVADAQQAFSNVGRLVLTLEYAAMMISLAIRKLVKSDSSASADSLHDQLYFMRRGFFDEFQRMPLNGVPASSLLSKCYSSNFDETVRAYLGDRDSVRLLEVEGILADLLPQLAAFLGKPNTFFSQNDANRAVGMCSMKLTGFLSDPDLGGKGESGINALAGVFSLVWCGAKTLDDVIVPQQKLFT